MLILIPGASGNLGVHLVRAALKRGHQVRALGRDRSKLPAGLKDQLEGFIEVSGFDDRSGLDSGCKGVDAIIVGYGGDPELVLDGQLALLRAAERAGIRRFHAMSWNLDWEGMAPGTIESYDPHIAFSRQAKQTSSIKPLYVFSGVLAMTLFGVPGAGALEGDNALWIRKEGEERIINLIGKGETKTPFASEADVAEFSVAITTADDAEKGGYYRFCSDQFTLKELQMTYEKVRGGKCSLNYAMDLETCKQVLQGAREQAEKSGEFHTKWKSYLGLVYGRYTEEGTYNPEPVDAAKFPDVPRTSLEEFIRANDWI